VNLPLTGFLLSLLRERAQLSKVPTERAAEQYFLRRCAKLSRVTDRPRGRIVLTATDRAFRKLRILLKNFDNSIEQAS
jgi:hypothetical protein